MKKTWNENCYFPDTNNVLGKTMERVMSGIRNINGALPPITHRLTRFNQIINKIRSPQFQASSMAEQKEYARLDPTVRNAG
jgi:hypothetical protein